MYDYFYGAEAEQFFFYRIPKVLFTEERFRSVSAEAKVLYGLLLDRMSLSCKNGWLDQAGRVYIIFTIEEVMTALGCADQKAGKLLHELESKCRLIERKRQGLGKPNLIYVKNFVDKAADNPVDNTSGSSTPSPESRFQNRENHDSGAVKITDQESLKSRSNNTDKNDTDFSDTDSFPFTSFRRDHGREAKGNEAALRERYRELIAENIAYDALLTDYPYEQDTAGRNPGAAGGCGLYDEKLRPHFRRRQARRGGQEPIFEAEQRAHPLCGGRAEGKHHPHPQYAPVSFSHAV